MKVFILLSIIIITILIVGKRFYYSAKRNLFKDEAAWSGKDIKIKYRNSSEVSKSKGSDNILKIIADESKTYLDTQSKKEDN